MSLSGEVMKRHSSKLWMRKTRLHATKKEAQPTLDLLSAIVNEKKTKDSACSTSPFSSASSGETMCRLRNKDYANAGQEIEEMITEG